jgi:hypothetical protein
VEVPGEDAVHVEAPPTLGRTATQLMADKQRAPERWAAKRLRTKEGHDEFCRPSQVKIMDKIPYGSRRRSRNGHREAILGQKDFVIHSTGLSERRGQPASRTLSRTGSCSAPASAGSSASNRRPRSPGGRTWAEAVDC